ncbi:DedA family protein [Sphingobium sp. Z007]|uniref:DedA family protein n=1 Tax=Sphingobium sp. Z007 TaxID=627495 RepID=UPI000B49D7CA|nr:DedA family protein [Sphingobium sp. Z007]
MGEWIQQLIDQLGYVGIAILMFAETVFPPLPSEVIMPLAGLRAARGSLSLAGAVAAGSAGAMAGNLCWYFAARSLGVHGFRRLLERHGRWLALDWSEVERSRDWLDRHGAAFVCLGRLIPTVRSVVSVPAGMLKMPLPRFAAWSAAGTVAWTAALTVAGYALGQQYTQVERYVGPVSTAIIVLLVIGYGWRVVRWHRKP